VSIKYVILGFLSQEPLTGYDLKKKFADSEIFHWSGNNNQIYKSLVELHQANLVTIEVEYQESKPPRKIYTVTDDGLAALRKWMLSTPELPEFRNTMLMQLRWADQLPPDALDGLLATYETELQAHIVLLREQARRNSVASEAKAQPHSFADRIADHWISFYELELDWVRRLRQELEGE
jgi:PadR family transcriptional regulator, regulatory protein AphA